MTKYDTITNSCLDKYILLLLFTSIPMRLSGTLYGFEELPRAVLGIQLCSL